MVTNDSTFRLHKLWVICEATIEAFASAFMATTVAISLFVILFALAVIHTPMAKPLAHTQTVVASKIETSSVITAQPIQIPTDTHIQATPSQVAKKVLYLIGFIFSSMFIFMLFISLIERFKILFPELSLHFKLKQDFKNLLTHYLPTVRK